MTVSARTIVVDVDDTISTHTDRDYVNAIPHLEIISKLNNLYDQGWNIIYFTARGQVSCSGDLELIEQTKGPTLRAWLKKHGVKYHELRFGKPVAVYYIDDKAIRPDEFMNINFKKLYGGSGAHIEVIGDRVIKSGPNLSSQVNWYNICSKHNIVVPKVYTFYDNTIDMEYVNGYSLNHKSMLTVSNIDKLIDSASVISGIVPEYKIPDWITMVNRVKEHLRINAIPFETEILTMIDDPQTHCVMNSEKTFMHGDLTLSNVIMKYSFGTVKPYFIDPNYVPDVYSSYLLDQGKILQSLHYHYEETFFEDCAESRRLKDILYDYLIKNYIPNHMVFYVHLMELVHYIRMVKYKNKSDKEKVFEIIGKLYHDCKSQQT